MSILGKASIVRLTVKWLLRLFFVIATPVFLLVSSSLVLVNATPLYKLEFKRHHVDTTTHFSEEQLREIAKQVRHYFHNSEKYLQINVTDEQGLVFDLFDDEEQTHMADVKALVRTAYVTAIILGAVLACLIALGFVRYLEVDIWLKWGGIATVIGVSACAVLAATNFDSMFTSFHSLFFGSGTWIFDQPGQYLVMLFPQAFWTEMAFLMSTLAITGGIIMFLIGFRHSRTSRVICNEKNSV